MRHCYISLPALSYMLCLYAAHSMMYLLVLRCAWQLRFSPNVTLTLACVVCSERMLQGCWKRWEGTMLLNPPPSSSRAAGKKRQSHLEPMLAVAIIGTHEAAWWMQHVYVYLRSTACWGSANVSNTMWLLSNLYPWQNFISVFVDFLLLKVMHMPSVYYPFCCWKSCTRRLYDIL